MSVVWRVGKGFVGFMLVAVVVASCAQLGASEGASRVIEVRMLDDGNVTRFEPSNIEVRRGDIVRFTQGGTMPHNVQFREESAPAGAELGEAWMGPYLMSAGEVYEIEIDERFLDGTYDFVCTPHMAMGMTGTLTVAGGDIEAVASTAPRVERPVVTGVNGNQLAEYTMDGDVKVFHLKAEKIQWEPEPGKLVNAMAYNRMIPGPTIRVQEGDRVRIVVENAMDEPHTTHWHGLYVPNNMDGVPGISMDPIQPGESFTYEFVANPAGTRLYHSHFNAMSQESAGLYGMFVIEERTTPEVMRADREEIMLLGDGTLGYILNGKGFPEVPPIEMSMGERVRVRMGNLGAMVHPMHLHGGYFDVVAKDGFPLPEPQKMNTLTISPGETYDIILHPQFPGVWIWHCHVLSHAPGPRDADGNETAAGMIAVVIVDDGVTPLADMRNHTNH
ncbi:MAG TPA: multicopper oxidase domain-containing protein [Longimicrobiales bacterium]|nr:multicopper oxidase domain-containing protein [Longimicrobiales bacterium]